eukprot:symbB.v1.2.001029.t1/scaffold52.1/size380577/19
MPQMPGFPGQRGCSDLWRRRRKTDHICHIHASMALLVEVSHDLLCRTGAASLIREPMRIPVKQLNLAVMLDLNILENEPARIDPTFISFTNDVSKEGSKSRKSRVKALPQAQSLLADADKIVRIRMPDVNKNAGPNRGVSTKGMNFLGMTDRRPRPPKGDGQPRS